MTTSEIVTVREATGGKTRRVRANVTLDAAILERSKAAGINLSRTLEAALAAALRERLRIEWQQENAGAIADYNDHIERCGIFGDDHRRF